MPTTPNLAALEQSLNAAVQSGAIMAAFEQYYADDVVMQENAETPVVGKPANRLREQAFVDSVATVHAIRLLASAVGDDVTFSEWHYDLTLKNGTRAVMHQACVRRWKDGRVASERFYYNKG